jgi:transcription initiation factor TFIIA small subunit
MKILLNFDKAVADVLSDKVKSRLTFKVSLAGAFGRGTERADVRL